MFSMDVMESQLYKDKTHDGLLKQLSKAFGEKPAFQTEEELFDFLEDRNESVNHDEQIFIDFHVLDVD